MNFKTQRTLSTRLYISQIFNRFHSNQVPYIFSYTSIYTSSSRIVLSTPSTAKPLALPLSSILFYLSFFSPFSFFLFVSSPPPRHLPTHSHIAFLFPFSLRDSYPFTPHRRILSWIPLFFSMPPRSRYSTERSSDIFPFIEFFSVKSRFRPPSTTLIYPIHPTRLSLLLSLSFSLSLYLSPLLLRYFHAFSIPKKYLYETRLFFSLYLHQVHFYSRPRFSRPILSLEVKFSYFYTRFKCNSPCFNDWRNLN